jgi:iron complex outermembrane receptor protein
MKSQSTAVTALLGATVIAAGAAAQSPSPAAGPAVSPTAEELQEIVIFSRGVVRQQQIVSAEQIDYLPAGTSPLKAIEKLPGVNFQAADPFGAYEWSTRIVVRGFNQNQLGFTLDGIPLGDMSYANHNGLHISRAVPSENVGRVVLSQGSGSLGTTSTSNLGGTIEFYSADPSPDMGARVDLTGGSDAMRRGLVRFDTGTLGGAGPRVSLTFADATAEKWKGAGAQDQRMYNLKVVQPIGEKGSLTAYYNQSDRAEIDYQDLSFDIIRRRGWDWDNFTPDWDATLRAAVSCAASGYSNAIVCDDAYWNASGLRKDNLGYLALSLPAGETLSFDVKAYLHRNDGQGLWGTPYVPTPGGAPLSVRVTEYDIDRKGAIATARWTLGTHQLEAGLWIESNDFEQIRRFYPEPSLTGPTQQFSEFLTGPLFTQWQYTFDTKTQQYHLQDAITVSDDLRVNIGVKGMKVENTVTTVTGPAKAGTIDVSEAFLPQAGIAYSFADGAEIFGQYARNARAFVSANTAGPFSTTAVGFEAIKDTLQPETSATTELGLRFRTTGIEGVLAAYRVSFKDRQLAIQQGPGIVGNPSVLANVGSVTTNGVEMAVNWRPFDHFSWFNSFAWNDSVFDNDYTTNGVVVPVKGKTELAYDNGRFFVRADANYVDSRYYTFLNIGKVPDYTILNGSIGYRFAKVAFLEELTVQGSVTNATDELYISTVGSNGFTNADPTGTSQTLLRGAPQQFFVSIKARF